MNPIDWLRLLGVASTTREENMRKSRENLAAFAAQDPRRAENAERASRLFEQRPLACDKPPKGWRCTRERGHEGPCAAWPDNSQ